MQPSDRLLFGNFLLDRRRRELANHTGRLVLHDRAFDMLVFLIDNRDCVVRRDQILQHVWHGLSVGENNLTVQMSNLRRLLATHGAADLIITVPGQGYRFVGEVEPVEVPASLPALAHSAVPERMASTEPAIFAPVPRLLSLGLRTRPRAVTAGLCLVALAAFFAIRPWRHPAAPPLLSIAVLPFRDLSDSPGHAYLAEEISDDLTVDLAYIPGSVVVAREAVALTATTGQHAAAAALKVRYLVEGDIALTAQGVGGNARLLDAATGKVLWGDHFDKPAAELAEARSWIVRRIASALDTTLTNIIADAAPVDRPDDADAENLFFEARRHTWKDDSHDGLAVAQHMLEKAIRRQPGFTVARAQLGLTLVLKLGSGEDASAAADLAEAQQLIAGVLSLASNSVALAANARLLESQGDCDAAVINAHASLALEPNNLDGWAVLAKCATAAGRLDEAASDIAIALRLNPVAERNKPREALLSQVELLRGHYAAAIEAANQAMLGDPPPKPGGASMGREEYVRLLRISATALSGNIDRARQLYVQYAAVWPNRSAWRVGAFSPRALAALPAFSRFTDGLALAGMPMVAAAWASAMNSSVPTSSDFAPTPLKIPGADTLDVNETVAELRSGVKNVVDVGDGAVVIKGALLIRAPGDAVITQIDVALADTNNDRNKTIIVMGSGAYGDTSVQAVQRVISLGYRHVCWFRGGEEAWFAAGLPSLNDRRVF